jgi:hypothetical protein
MSAPEMSTPEHPPGTASQPDPREATAPSDEQPDEGQTADAGGSGRSGGMPEYKGEPLDAERGPGLGCFWIQIGLLTFFLILTPLTVTWGWDPFISGALLIFTLVLLLFSGQTIIFLLRLVAADRRARRAPLDPAAKPTVGQMEEMAPASPAESREEAPAGPTAGDDDG